MNEVIKCLADYYCCEVHCIRDTHDGIESVSARNDFITMRVLTPQAHNGLGWILQFSPLVTFKGWDGLHIHEMRFGTLYELYECLSYKQADIYFFMLIQLAEELYCALDTIKDFQLP